ANGAVRVRRRFSYDEVSAILAAHREGKAPAEPGGSGSAGASASREGEPEVVALLLRMRDLAVIPRKRRPERGALELTMPETELEYDAQGRVTGAHFRKHDVSHQVIEEFMLAANEAVAEHLAGHHIAFLRRVHPAPEPNKLRAFAEFARILGYK